MSRRANQTSRDSGALSPDEIEVAEEALRARRAADAEDESLAEDDLVEEQDDTEEPDDESDDAGDDAGSDAPGRSASDWEEERQRLLRERDEAIRRWKGLQPVVQQRTETVKQLQARLDQLEQQYVASYIQSLPEEQQAFAAALYQAERANRLQQQQQAEQQEQIISVVGPALLEKMAATTGVPLEELMEFAHDPYLAQAYAAGRSRGSQTAKQTQRQQRTAQKKQRKAAGKDKFEGGASVSRPIKKPRTFAEAREALRRNYRVVPS